MLFCAVFLLSLRLMGSFFLLNLSCKSSLFQPTAECTGGQVYTTCGTLCPRTCENHQLDFACISECVRGCFCPDDTVLHDGQCIPSWQCPGESVFEKFFYTNHILFLGFVFLVHLISTLWWLAQVLQKSYRLFHFLTLEMYSIALHILLRPGRVVDKFCELHFTLCCCRSLLFG